MMQRRRKPLAMLGGLALAGAPAAAPAAMPPAMPPMNAAPMGGPVGLEGDKGPWPNPGSTTEPYRNPGSVVGFGGPEGGPAQMPPAGGMPPGMPMNADAPMKGLPGSTTEPYRNPGSLVDLGGGGGMRRGPMPAVGMRKPMARLGLAMAGKKRRQPPQRLGGPAY